MDALPPFFDSLAEYPRWFVVACVTVVAALGIWLLIKVVKMTLYILLVAVIVGGLAMVGWLLMN